MNGYPDNVIEKTIARKLKDFTSTTSHTVRKCLVYLHLPWLGTPLVEFENKIKISVQKMPFAVEQRVFLHLAHFFLHSKRMCCLLRF